jgi:UV DNA damage repair endonuclease
MSKKKIKKIYKYDCTITGETFKTTAEAQHPGELTTISAYYLMNSDKDDRPIEIKVKVKAKEEDEAALKALTE